MEYIKIKFGTDFEENESKFQKVIDDMFQSINPLFTLSEKSWKPQMDVCETTDEIIILSELAGVDKENLTLEINSKAIKLYGKRHGIPPEKKVKYRLAEIQYGTFERILHLPVTIDTEKVSASYSNGFLEIRLAKLSRKDIQAIAIQYDK